MSRQLALDLFAGEKRLKTCIWREEWHGYPFCYLRQTFRLLPCCARMGTTDRKDGYGTDGSSKAG